MTAATYDGPAEVAIPPWDARSRAAVGAAVAEGCAEALAGLREIAQARDELARTRFVTPGSHTPAALERARLALRHAAAAVALQTASADPAGTLPTSIADALAPGAGVDEIVGVYRWLAHLLVHVLDRPAPADTDAVASALTLATGTPVLLDPDHSQHAALYSARVAALYDAHRPFAPELAEGVMRFARGLAGRRVLELGAGTGQVGRLMLDHVQQYDGIDISPAMLARFRAAVTRWPDHATLTCADACALPWPTATFDVTVEHAVLLFTADPLRAVDEALRVLRPGGTLVRLLVHAVGRDPIKPLHAAFREGAAATLNRPFAMRGAGTDPRITEHLRVRGIATEEIELSRWDETTSLVAVERSLRAGALPFADGLPTAAIDEGIRRLRARAGELGLEHRVHATRRAYILVSRRPR